MIVTTMITLSSMTSGMTNPSMTQCTSEYLRLTLDLQPLNVSPVDFYSTEETAKLLDLAEEKAPLNPHLRSDPPIMTWIFEDETKMISYVLVNKDCLMIVQRMTPQEHKEFEEGIRGSSL